MKISPEAENRPSRQRNVQFSALNDTSTTCFKSGQDSVHSYSNIININQTDLIQDIQYVTTKPYT